MRTLKALLLGLLALLAVGCKHWPPEPGTAVSKIVDCATQAIRDRGLTYVGKVNDVLANHNLSDTEARNSLVQLGIDAGQDVLGCLLSEQGSRFAETAGKNPADSTSALAARRARLQLNELESQGWQYRNVPAPPGGPS